MNKSYQILFVCSGNSCRSPMAEGILRSRLPQDLQDKVRVLSAGTLGLSGYPATEEAIQVSKEIGVDISEHISQGLSPELVEESNIIFAMAQDHIDYLLHHFPEKRENIFLLKRFARDDQPSSDDSIIDPIGMRIDFYRTIRDIIAQEIDRILPRLTQLITDYLRL